MSQKNLYFKDVHARKNAFWNFILKSFMALASPWKLFLEVFIRKNFGRRYFNRASVISVAVVLALLPLAIDKLGVLISSVLHLGGDDDSSFWLHYATWYLAIIAFLYASYQRMKEIDYTPAYFNFTQFSKSSGQINPWFYSIKLFGKSPDIRRIETLIEPGVFFLLGLALWILGQKIGIIIWLASIFYSFSYMHDYMLGDNFILDKIDEQLMNRNMEESFASDDDEERFGIRYRFNKPTDHEMRLNLLDQIIVDETPGEFAT